MGRVSCESLKFSVKYICETYVYIESADSK